MEDIEAAGIAKEKVEELCKLIPGLKNEIDWSRGSSKSSKDSVIYIFKNGSQLDIIAARQSSRGKRKTGGLIEEVSKIALIYLFPYDEWGFANAS